MYNCICITPFLYAYVYLHEYIYRYVCVCKCMCICMCVCMSKSVCVCVCRRKFRSQTSDNMDRWKAEMGRVREKRRVEERRKEKRKSQKKEDAGARKGRKVAKHCVFPMFVAPEARKVRSLKRRVRSHLARWEMKNCTPLWGEAHFEVKMYKTHQLRTTLGSCDVKKVHAVVAWSTFPSQNVQNTSAPEHF